MLGDGSSRFQAEAKAAIFGCRNAIKAASRPVALQAQVTLDTSGRMLLGTDVGAAMVTIAEPSASTSSRPPCASAV